MVERLKEAIAKARAQRSASTEEDVAASRTASTAKSGAEASWSALPTLDLNGHHLERERIVSYGRTDQAHVLFDTLRTRLLKLAADNGWRRIGVTSPTKGCGKSVVCLNLSFSLARHPETRTLALDFDLRAPALARRLGAREPGRIADLLSGAAAPTQMLRRVGDRLAYALNDRSERDSAELLHATETAVVLDRIEVMFQPTIMLFDLPPMLGGDDALASLPLLDGVLLIAGGGRSKPSQLTECRDTLADQGRLAGVVLNRAEGVDVDTYGYAATAD